MWYRVTVFASLLSAELFAADVHRRHEPARLQRVVMPRPVLSAGTGEAVLELRVDRMGRVSGAAVLLDGPQVTTGIREFVRGWGFSPAREDGRPAQTRVLVAALFRQPSPGGPHARGQPPVRPSSPSVPWPIVLVSPDYPPPPVRAALVLLEVTVGTEGGINEATVLRGEAPFLRAALTAARLWRFRPGEREGRPALAIAYLIFGFHGPAPMTATR
jgi:eukaryotic-like serine/threonine-protein kinase